MILYPSTPRNKTIVYLSILALVSLSIFFIPAQAVQNASVPANTSQAANQTITVEQVIETAFLIGIILSPLSFFISVVALWVAWKNRRKTYEIK